MIREFASLIILLDLKLADFWGMLRSLTLSRIFGMSLSVAVAILIAALIYRFDLFVFDYLMGMPDLGRLIIARFFELAFLLYFLALVISTALTALSMLYREKELTLLLTLPVSHGTIFVAKYFEVIIYSSWALLALTIPFVMSYAVYFRVDWPVYIVIFGGLLLPMVVIAGSAGIAVALLIRWLLGGISRRKLLTGGVGLLVLLILVGIGLKLLQQDVTERGVAFLFSMLEMRDPSNPSLLPHLLISRGFTSILEARWDLLHRVVLSLVGIAFLLMLLTLDFGRVIYYRSWLATSDRAPTRGRRSAFFKSSFWRLEKWISPIYRALFRKDLLEFRRHPLQWGQSLLLIGFWVLYITNVINLKVFFDFDSVFWQLVFFYGNFSVSAFFAAAVAGRFIFPVISLEGPSFWVIKAAPLAMDSFIWSKFWQSFLPLFLLTGSMLSVGNVILGVHTGLFQASLLCILIITAALTAMALGMGAIFADFSQHNPMKIANSPGGVLCIFISLVVTVLLTTIFAWPTYLSYKATLFQTVFPVNQWVTVVILFLALGIVITLLPLMMGLKALNRDLKI